MGGLSIEEVTDVKEFRHLGESWNTLLRESCDNNIFLTWEWLFIWWQHYGSDKKLRIFLIKENDKIIGIAPFMQSKYRKGIISVDVLENLCSRKCDYSGVILTERKHESVAILLDYLEELIRDKNIIVRISQVPENSNFLTLLREQYPSFSSSLSLYERVVSSCPYIDLPTTWDEYFGTLSRNRRGILRRAIRTLEKNYKVELKRCVNGDNLREHLQVLFELHQKRWQLRNIRSKFTESEAREFYVDVSEAFQQNKWLDLSFLNVDGKPASIIWGFNYNGKYYYMTPAFDPSFSDRKVGNVHIMLLIKDTIQNDLRNFDFLKGAEAHKSHWTLCAKDNIQIIMAKRGFWSAYRLKLLKMLIKYKNIRACGLLEYYHQNQVDKRQQRGARMSDTSTSNTQK